MYNFARNVVFPSFLFLFCTLSFQFQSSLADAGLTQALLLLPPFSHIHKPRFTSPSLPHIFPTRLASDDCRVASLHTGCPPPSPWIRTGHGSLEASLLSASAAVRTHYEPFLPPKFPNPHETRAPSSASSHSTLSSSTIADAIHRIS